MAETSDTTFLNRCMRHLDIFKAEPRYNSSNSALVLAALEAKLASGYPIVEAVLAKVAPFNIKINERQAAYAKIDPMVRASRRYLKSSGATDAEIADANTIINKILNSGGKKKETVDPNQPAEAVKEKNSTSHRSYDARYGNLMALREFYANVSAYNPNEDPVKLTAFDAVLAECQAANEAVSQAFVEIFEAWNERDAKLYDDADSILEDFRDAKEYYKSLYTSKDPQYKAIERKDMALTNNSRVYK